MTRPPLQPLGFVQKRIVWAPEPVSQQTLPPPQRAQSEPWLQGRYGVPPGQSASRMHSQGAAQPVIAQQIVLPVA